MPGLMRGRWELLTAVVRGRRVRRSVREQLQVRTSALLYHLVKGCKKQYCAVLFVIAVAVEDEGR